MGSYFPYYFATCDVRAVTQVMKVLSRLSGGKESDFPYLQTGGESDFHNHQTGGESSLHINFKVKMPLLKRDHVIPAHTSIPISLTAHDIEKLACFVLASSLSITRQPATNLFIFCCHGSSQ